MLDDRAVLSVTIALTHFLSDHLPSFLARTFTTLSLAPLQIHLVEHIV
jgi:hypothetical protein